MADRLRVSYLDLQRPQFAEGDVRMTEEPRPESPAQRRELLLRLLKRNSNIVIFGGQDSPLRVYHRGPNSPVTYRQQLDTVLDRNLA